jgi:M6 family metalloprotease-like protein
LNMIVVLVRFADHVAKQLPARDDYDVLFNTLGNVDEIAPTGSLKKFYQTVSLGRFSIESTVEEWITIGRTEEDVAYGQHGLHDQYSNIANTALKRMDERGVDWNIYDKNGDGELDAVFIVHSGYSGESGGTDCFNNKEWGPHRIWSHRGYAGDGGFVSVNGNVRMASYATASGLISSCGSQIVRLGSICHEFGHLLGIPDMVGKSGNGIGTWDVMGLLWGADGSQYLPGMFGAYSRQRLGWAYPQKLTTSGWYRLRTSAIYGDVYRIDAGFADGEYLLIENRQAVYYDKNIPSTGLMIWHIDENVDGGWQSRPGWPGQEGWPYNGNHYHVSILQADGLYELEKGINNCGAGDLFAGPGVGLFPGGPYPNSDGYSGGFIFQSGVTISDISESSDDMTFRFSIPADSAPTSQPNLRATQNPSAHPTTTSILATLSPPTNVPTPHPITEPTLWSTLEEPTLFPRVNPTDMHTSNPTRRPTRMPTPEPTPFPSTPIMVAPVADHPTRRPTVPRFPTVFPSPSPSDRPHFPTIVPSPSPSDRPPVTPGPVDFTAFVPVAPSPPAVPTRRPNRVRPTRAPIDLSLSETKEESLVTGSNFLTDPAKM